MRPEMRAYYDWREKIRGELPSLCARVFALRGRSYKGAGFHWSMEKTLGFVMRAVSDYDNCPDVGSRVVEEIAYEGLLETLDAAEKSIA